MAECEQNKDVSSSACMGCAMKDRCLTNEDTGVSRRQRWKAVLLAYILPFVVLLAILIVVGTYFHNEYLAGGIALGGVAIYFVILYFNKPTI